MVENLVKILLTFAVQGLLVDCLLAILDLGVMVVLLLRHNRVCYASFTILTVSVHDLTCDAFLQPLSTQWVNMLHHLQLLLSLGC